MVASPENHQRNVKNQATLPIWYVQKKSLKKIFSHILHIFMPYISGFLFYLHFTECLLFCFYLIIMLLNAVASWRDERLKQISHCCFLSVSVVWSQQNLPPSSSVD